MFLTKTAMKTPKKILVVDDNDDIAEALVLLLKRSGYSADRAFSAEECMYKVEEDHPDLVLLDIFLSGSDGREVCRKLKAQVETEDLPIIIISAHPNMREPALAAGANDFISKPFPVDDLLKKVEQFLPMAV